MEVSSTILGTWHQLVSGELHGPAALHLEKEPRSPLDSRLGGPLWTDKFLTFAGDRTPVVRFVACRYPGSLDAGLLLKFR